MRRVGLVSLGLLASLAAGCSENAPNETQAPSRDSAVLTVEDVAAGLPAAGADAVAIEALLDDDGGDPFYVATLLRYVEGARSGDITVADLEATLPDGAEVVFGAEVERQLQGEPVWEWVEVVRYPDAAAYTSMLGSAEGVTLAQQRSAVVAEAHVIVATPVTPITEEPLVAGQEPPPLPIPAEVPFPATVDDPPFMLVAAVSIADQAEYEDGRETDLSGEEALGLHYEQATPAGDGVDLGIRPVIWMDVESTLIGDADRVDSIRFNYWPSHATLLNLTQGTGVVGGPSTENRTAGLDDAWTMIALPELDRFTART